MSAPSTRPTAGMTPRFITLNGRRLFTLEFAPAQGAARASLLYLPPFAEEMNRCRSHVAVTARALAAHGTRVVLLDLWATGESEGDDTEPTWNDWLDDAQAAFEWMTAQFGTTPDLWGMRTGAMLAGMLCERLQAMRKTGPARLLLWQPVLDGKLFLNQYLRLRIASQLVHDGERETAEKIRARLAAGEILEVAGYPLSGRMAASLADARMPDAKVLSGQSLYWLEIVAKDGQDAGMAARKLADAVQATGGTLAMQVVPSPPIWQTFDREHAPALPVAMLRLLGLSTEGTAT